MDSNENSDDKSVAVASKMEASDLVVQDKNDEPETDKVDAAKLAAEKIDKSEVVDDMDAETNENAVSDFSPLPAASTGDEKINTVLTDSEVPEGEKIIDDKPNSVASSENSDMDTLELKLISPEPPNDDEGIGDIDTSVVNNKNIKSTNNAMDIADTCDKKEAVNETNLTQEGDNLKEESNDTNDSEITKNTVIAESTQKEEDVKSFKNIEDTKDVKKTMDTVDVKNTIETENVVDVKNIKEKKEIKNEVDTIKDEENEKSVKIKKMKEPVETVNIKETKTEIVEKSKKSPKTEAIKDSKETLKTPESLENKKAVIIKHNKILRDVRSMKEAKNIKNIKEAEIVKSMSTREGKRKRRSTMTPSERNSPTTPESPPQQQSPSLAQQQQNGSAPKRKRTAVVELTAAVAPSAASAESASKEAPSKNDKFCWRCHKESVEMQCSGCPRSWHRRCMGGAPPLNVTDWLCSECTGIIQAEDAESRSPAMAQLTIEQLSAMLRHVVQRMRDQTGSEPFLKAVDLDEVPNYLDYVINPMDLSLLDSSVRAKKYSSTDAFMADAKWIQHNCIVFNTYSSKLTNTAKQMLKVARQEVSEIEACPDCFAHGRNLPRPLPAWFIEPCRRPHPIVWAKLKGFPFWPAKAMPRLNAQGLIDVRFFGEHDRAWVSPKDIFLYSKEPPAGTPRKKKTEMEQCVKEVQDHVKKIERVFGEFKYAPQKVQYDPQDPKQIQILLPNYDPTENKVNKKENSKAEVQTPAANNKSTPAAKVERKSTNSKNAVVVVSNTNGVTASTPATTERRKMLRKKRLLSPQPQDPPAVPNKMSKPSPEAMEKVAVVVPPKKSKSKSPPASVTATTPVPAKATPTATPSNTSSDKSNNNKEPIKSSSDGNASEATPKSDASNGSNNNNGIPKPTLVPVKKVRQGVVKKIKLTKEPTSKTATAEPSMRKPMVVVKTLNIGKPATIIHSMPPLNNYTDNLETTPVKIVRKNLISILPKKNQFVNSKTIHLIRQDGKVLKRTMKRITVPVTKDTPNFPLVIAQQKDKSNTDSTPSGNNSKSLSLSTSSTKKEQKTAMFNDLNSNMSELSKHYVNGDKEMMRLNPAVTIIKQEPRDDLPVQSVPMLATLNLQPKLAIVRTTKPGKARKSFPNKSPQFPQQSPSVPTIKPSSSATSDTKAHIPVKQSSEKRSTTSSSAAIAASASAVVSSSSYELPPAEAGPATAQIHRHSKELANKMAQLIADTIRDAAESNGTGAGNVVNHHEATIHYLKLKMERMKWEHEQEINELRHNNDQRMREKEAEQQRALEEARREAELDKRRSIEETKRKQWCVVCGREAMFFCCWNTAYCDYPCQQKHWAAHVNNCAQKNQTSSQSSSSPSSSASSPPQQTQKPNSAKHQVMPKLVTTKPQQSMPVMRKANASS